MTATTTTTGPPARQGQTATPTAGHPSRCLSGSSLHPLTVCRRCAAIIPASDRATRLHQSHHETIALVWRNSRPLMTGDREKWVWKPGDVEVYQPDVLDRTEGTVELTPEEERHVEELFGEAHFDVGRGRRRRLVQRTMSRWRWRRHVPERRTRLADDVLGGWPPSPTSWSTRPGASAPRSPTGLGRARWCGASGRGGSPNGRQGEHR